MAPEREQLFLTARCWVEFPDPTHDQPCGDLVGGRREGGVGRFGDLGIRDPLPDLLVVHRTRVPHRYPRMLVDGVDGRPEFRVGLQAQQKFAPAVPPALPTGPEPNAESPRTRI